MIDNAMLKCDLQALDQIQRLESCWKTGLRNKEIAFDFAFDRQITEHYREWIRHADLCMVQIELMRRTGCDLELAAEFEERIGRAKETLILRIRSEAAALVRYRVLHGFME